jgi:excisionase family DNA binding protein
MTHEEGDVFSTANGQRKLLTPLEVADFLQIKLPRIYELVKARRIRAVRIGRQLRFRPTDLEAFLERSVTGRW